MSRTAESEFGHRVVDETKPTKNLCLANVGPDDDHYESCGITLRKHKDGTLHCKIHGEMI
jgi:hypothetical protein